VYILVVEAIERQKTGVEYAEINGITLAMKCWSALLSRDFHASSFVASYYASSEWSLR
jgi:hypothetical protein